jgi:hypothetical protein
MWMYRKRTSSSAKAWASALAATLAFAVVGLELLDPDTLLSVDAAVKLFQARALLLSEWRSVTIPYPGSALDPAFSFFPLVPPFVFRVGTEWQGVFPTAVALLNAACLTLGTKGLVLLSVAAGGSTVFWSSWILGRDSRWVVGPLLAAATCFWFYAVLPWEHAPAAAFSTAAVVLVLDARSSRKMVVAGLLLGMAIVLREESLLLIPGILVMAWWRGTSHAALAAFTLACAFPSVSMIAADVGIFGRPAAAHLRHRADPLEWLGLVRESALPRLEGESLASRIDFVVHEWLLGVHGPAYSVVFLSALILIGVTRREQWRVWGSVIAAAIVLGLAVRDLAALIPHPDFVPGLLRLSPVLIFAALPCASIGRCDRRRLEILVTAGVYLAAMLLVANTTGGASLGPRLLIPILPLLTAAAWDGLESYRTSGHLSPLYRITWGLGLALVATSVLMQSVAVRAYVTFNRVEREAVRWVRDSPEAVVVDSPFTTSVVAPVYLDRPVFRAETQQDAASLAARLALAGVRGMLLVSRAEQQRLEFAPFSLVQTRRAGHTTVQRWAR